MSKSFEMVEEKKENSSVNHPSHYNQGKIEIIDFIEDQDFGYLAGNVIKYVCRYRWKGSPVEDLCKARFHLNRLIANLGGDILFTEEEDE